LLPEHPFAPTGTRGAFVETPVTREALARLAEGLGAREPFLVMTGEPGTGKSAILEEALARWNGRVTAAVLAYPALSGAELLEEIVRRLGQEPPDGATRPRLLAAFECALQTACAQGRVAMIVVDDAHELPLEAYDELALLVKTAARAHHVLEVLMAGGPALDSRLAEPAAESVRARVSARVSVTALPPAETQRYVHQRVGAAGGDGPGLFARRTCREIASLSGGVPRRINALAGEALRLARAAGQPTVTPEHTREAAAALWGAAAVAPGARAAAAEPAAGVDVPPPAPDEVRVAPPAPPTPAAPSAPTPATRGEARSSTAAERVVPAPRPTPRSAPVPASEPEPPARPAVTHHDPKEWVQRFIGDRGPVQLSSQAMGGSFARMPVDREEPAATAPRPASAVPANPKRRARPVRVPRPVLGAALVASAVVVALVIGVRVIGHALAKHASAAVTAPPAKAPAPSAAVAASGSSDAPRVTSVPAAPGPESSANAAAASAADPEHPDRRWTIEVGEYLDLDRALAERDRVWQATGTRAWVVPGDEGRGESNRVVLGIYRSPERATASAEALLGRISVPTARVVVLPSRHSRR
jgi:type II secretory pathway predicted ATPase ExeA